MNTTFLRKLSDNESLLQKLFAQDSFLKLRFVGGADAKSAHYMAAFVDGMVNSELINVSVIYPLSVAKRSEVTVTKIDDLLSVLHSNEAECVSVVADAVTNLLRGDTLVFCDGVAGCVVCNTKGGELRSISEPDREKTLRGPRDGFAENFITNVSLIRRRLQTTDFKCEVIRVGERTRTGICICYLGSLIRPEILDELKHRITSIDIDGILESSYIEEQISEHPYSPFQTVGSTEKPDIAAARLLEGRAAVVIDGSPVVLTVPYLFAESFQSADDYYLPFIYSSVGRMLRYLGFFLATLLPGLYIAFVCFHHESIPEILLLKIARASNGVPFPTIVECTIMLAAYEILRETGVRMSNKLGQALSIVGALVLGQAAVESGIVSNAIVIVVALSGITSLMVPRLKTAVLIVRLLCMVLGAFLGLYGVFIAAFMMYIHLMSLESFGVFYMEGFGALSYQRTKDILWRAPGKTMKTRPSFARDRVRQR